jgi:hypothetical protein
VEGMALEQSLQGEKGAMKQTVSLQSHFCVL